jgi:hypothetical protein
MYVNEMSVSLTDEDEYAVGLEYRTPSSPVLNLGEILFFFTID